MNAGKRFEENFRKSVPSYCLVHRLKDSAQSYNNSKKTKFTWDNPCDFFVYNSKSHFLYTLELKSTKYKSMSFEKEDEGKTTKMVKWHQIESLTDMSEFDGVVSGFLFNFRDEKNDMERTYFQDIISFNNMCKNINKTSFNEMDLILNNAVKIDGKKKRVNYAWDIDSFLNSKHD